MFDKKILTLLVIYVSAILMSNLLWLKTLPFLFGTHISFAVFTLPLIFVTIDVVWKIYGKDMAKIFVFLGFFSLLLFTWFSLLSQVLPWAEQSFWRIGEAYNTIFSLSFRVTIASLCAFFVSEFLDIHVFFRFKNQKNSFFLASLASNIVSQFIDTALFMFIAFYGVFDVEKIIMMALPWWIYKVSMGVIYMPFAYTLLHFFSKKYEQKV